MLNGCLHKLKQVLVMLLGDMAMYAYVIMYGNNTGEMVCCLVHAHLKDILGHLHTEWYVLEMVPAMMDIECGQIGRFLIDVHAPEAILSIQLPQAGSCTELIRELIKNRGFIMFSHNGLLRSFGLRHMPSVPLGLWGYVRHDTHSVGWETEAIAPLVTMSVRVHSICSWYCMGTFFWACWTGGTEGSVLMVYVADMLPIL